MNLDTLNNGKISRERFLSIITVIYSMLMITSNVMALKVIEIAGVTMDAGTVTYPLTFMIGDMIAENFGYKTARNLIWYGFGANLLFSVFAWTGTLLPAQDVLEPLTIGYNHLFTYSLRILLASFTAYLVGSLLNAASLIWIRRVTGTRWVAVRTIGSTALGALVDTAIFTVLAWAGTMPLMPMIKMGLCGYGIKMAYEGIIATPLNYVVNPFIKKRVEI
ncbi:MAG: queuosine precursor transporter [Oscillospiraceae bacterium]|jgi:uncharacterized integral membrane protein (TIGR00697 family)|nr:queuosine precursor transporter [Oscillospiraceae bacterium]